MVGSVSISPVGPPDVGGLKENVEKGWLVGDVP